MALTPPVTEPGAVTPSEVQEIHGGTTGLRRDVDRLSTLVERLVLDVSNISQKLDTVAEKAADKFTVAIDKVNEKISTQATTIDRFRTILITVGVCLGIFLPAFGTLLWWSVGDRIDAFLKPATQVAPPPSVPPTAPRTK